MIGYDYKNILKTSPVYNIYFKSCINIYMLISCFKSTLNVKLILSTLQP
jgi:hypothetical protein